ncbi:phosphatidylinositol N-acetylglucosaminyltransferase subunit P [Sesamum indicum]|uniref:Phosphatidylinositol N-acetylglucosaminyltransferase subunit P n=1 Tax=Sesamum indicum TaxID=4182 RepID=A0A6I9U0I6_SESIN|nr:phosphatidylinositol N-acetylglucosaminyltransferase subunit P [Sesamum indicum]
MEGRSFLNIPRRILSFIQNGNGNGNAGVPFSDADDQPPTGFSGSAKRGERHYEVYGLVGSVTTVFAAVIFLIWVYVPDYWLNSIGIYYHPSRYLALPYVVVTIVVAIGIYVGMDFLATPPPTSLKSIFDEWSEEPAVCVGGIPSANDEDYQPSYNIQPITDIDINQVDETMCDELATRTGTATSMS